MGSEFCSVELHWNDVKSRQKVEDTIKVLVRFCENEN